MKKYLIIILSILSCNQSDYNNDYKIQAQVWTQNSAEYRALCYQAFNAAKMNLDAILFFDKKSFNTSFDVDFSLDEFLLLL